MGAVGSLGRSPRFYALLRERNQHLRRALDALNGDVQEFLNEVDRYEQRVSADRRARVEPDQAWSDVRKHLHAAALLSSELPRTSEGLQKTLKITGQKN
ncbi:hypothetical protein D9M70_640520 [compost metagenome]